MKQFLVTVLETNQRVYVVDAESEDEVWDMPAEQVMDEDRLYADYGGDVEFRFVDEKEADK